MKLPCVVCSDVNSHGHHEDYSKPLEVIWLCALHHGQRHIEINRGIALVNSYVLRKVNPELLKRAGKDALTMKQTEMTMEVETMTNTNTTTGNCPRCDDTLYPETHHVMCQECGAMAVCANTLGRSIFGGFVCERCLPRAIMEGAAKPLTHPLTFLRDDESNN